MNCQACGAPLSAGARYCHKCGAGTGTHTVAGWRVGLPWGIVGLAVGALLAVLLMRAGGGSGAAALAGDTPLGGAPAAGGVAAPDISQMSPEERAQRLFDRVMRLGEEGRMDSIQFFLPMAIGAYQQLPALSLDSHFDIGLLRLVGGDARGANIEADAIRRLVPTHLFASVLRARALQAQNDAAGARRAYLDFLKNETAERARRRPEYEEHGRLLDAFHSEALGSTGRSGP
ncbi:MAG: zinc ribbon domain-containing protein [Gemmatimonadales bacterium]